MAGRYFEQLKADDVFEHEVKKTITESDNSWFCAATYNPAQIHIDADYCADTEFGKPLVNSVFTLGLVVGVSVQDTTLGTTIANLGFSEVTFPNPVFAGDTIKSRTTVIETRKSKSRENAGIVTFMHEGFNQKGEVVCRCKRQALMMCNQES
ncbi:MaoC family dehydratase [Marinobacter sp. NP-6]|uniref:MaoC family dehydratase n=1 Tax=Marinobacter sp. NP-6 TaxID=2488666 RepID=UPI000FC9F3F0|nr:MaoC family dehydratase [Marinobacter sp. NP-6]RUT76934.1 MaoC family dehydratase [Marinobacter sp. NP-6]